MHLVFRSRFHKMHAKARRINEVLQRTAKRHHVHVYRFSNNNNHLHLVVKGKYRRELQNFLRVFAGRVAQLVSGAVRGNAAKLSFWELPVWSHIIESKAFRFVCAYVEQNALEAAGVIPYQPRGRRSAATRVRKRPEAARRQWLSP